MNTITQTSSPASATQPRVTQKQFQGNADSQPEQSQTQDQQPQQAGTTDGHASRDQIAKEAYRVYLENGSRDGHCLENWLEAERRLRHSGAAAIA